MVSIERGKGCSVNKFVQRDFVSKVLSISSEAVGASAAKTN